VPVQLLRPNTVAIFATDPTGTAGVAAKLTAFLLTQAQIDLPGRFRFDLVRQYTHSSGFDAARSPVEQAVADNLVKRPESLTVSGSLSATPVFAFGGGTGAFGSLIRRDLIQLKALQRLADVGEPLVVVTPSQVFGSMAPVSIQDVHTMDHKVELTITFEEIQIVSPLSVDGALDLDALLAGAGATEGIGGQATGAVPDPGGPL